MQLPLTIRARYPGRCPRCRRAFPVGVQIVRHQQRGWLCKLCSEVAQAEAESIALRIAGGTSLEYPAPSEERAERLAMLRTYGGMSVDHRKPA